MIRSFKHKGLERFYKTGSKAGIQPAHAAKLDLQLSFLECALGPENMRIDGWDLHRLRGELDGHWSVKVNANWRLTFRFIDDDVDIMNYQDYH